jgi:hypothetical protein
MKITLAVITALVLGVICTFFGLQWWQAQKAEEAAQAAAAPLAVQRMVVREWLNDPDSAQFRNEQRGPRGKNVWCGEVNARNRMGGMVGFSRYIAEVSDFPEDKIMNRVSIESDSDTGNAFQGKWRIFCEP